MNDTGNDRRLEEPAPRVGNQPAVDTRILVSREQTVLVILHASPFTHPGGNEFRVRDLVEALRLKRLEAP